MAGRVRSEDIKIAKEILALVAAGAGLAYLFARSRSSPVTNTIKTPSGTFAVTITAAQRLDPWRRIFGGRR